MCGTGSRRIPAGLIERVQALPNAVRPTSWCAVAVLLIALTWFAANGAFTMASMNRVFSAEAVTRHRLLTLATLMLASVAAGWLAARRSGSAFAGSLVGFLGGMLVALVSGGLREGMYYNVSVHGCLDIVTACGQFLGQSFAHAFGPWEFAWVAGAALLGTVGGQLGEPQ